MGSTSADDAAQSLFHLRFSGVGIRIEQGLGGHDHAVRAVAALGRLLGDEGSLYRVRLLGSAQAFEGRDGFAGRLLYRGDAGAGGLALHDDGAGAALRHAAAEFGAVEFEIIAKNVEKGLIGIPGFNGCFLAIQLKFKGRHNGFLRDSSN